MKLLLSILAFAAGTGAALADNHPPVAAHDSVNVTEGRTIELDPTYLLLNDTDADGDTLAVTGAGPLSAEGGTVLFPSSNNRLLYTPPAGFVGPDSFGYTVSDGHGGTATAQVSVLVLSANLPTRNIKSIAATPGGMRVLFVGVPGRTFLVQRSTDLTRWTTLATRTAPGNVVFEYLDDNPPPASVFYRAILL